MTTESGVALKMSARKNLSSVFGELDREQTKADLKYWNDHFNTMFASKWGVDPRTGELTGQGAYQWEAVSEPSDLPTAYTMSSLTWACQPRDQRCPSLHHLGLSGSRTTRDCRAPEPRDCSTPEPRDCSTPEPRDCSTPEPQDCSTPEPRDCSAQETGLTKPEIVEPLSETHCPLTLSEIPEGSRTPDRPLTPDQCLASSSVEKHISVSNKRKQSSILEFYPQKKRTCVRKLPQS